MISNPTPPIERRPMTTKQARRKWQKKGCPTLSSAEQRRLKRAAELEERARAIREKEKKRKENAQKRKERDGREREKRKRTGIEETVKLPEGQLGLGQFFKAKAANIEPTKRFSRAESGCKPDRKQDQETDDKFADLDNDVTNAELAKAVPMTTKAEERGGFYDDDFCNHGAVQFTRYNVQEVSDSTAEIPSRPSKAMSRKRKPQRDTQTCSERSTKRQFLHRSPFAEINSNVVPHHDLDIESPCNQPIDNISAKSPICTYYSKCKASKSAPASRQMSPDAISVDQRSRSVPSTMVKMDREISIDLGIMEDTDNISSIQNHRQTLPPSQQLTRPDDPQDLLKNVPPRLSNTIANSSGDEKLQVEENAVDSNPKIATGDSSSWSKRLPSVTESFGGGLMDDDLLGVEITAEEAISEATSNSKADESYGTPQGLPKSMMVRSSCGKKCIAKPISSDSFSCGFSSQELALLENVTNEPLLPTDEQSHQTFEENGAGESLSAPRRSKYNPTTNRDLLSSDGFDFLGGTQELASLIEGEDSLQIGRSPVGSSKIVNCGDDQSLIRTTILPPPRPLEMLPTMVVQRSILPQSPEQDEFDFYNGSTQALLDL